MKKGIAYPCNFCVLCVLWKLFEEKVWKGTSTEHHERGSRSLGGLSLFVHLCTIIAYIYCKLLAIWSILVRTSCIFSVMWKLSMCSFSIQFATRYIMCPFFGEVLNVCSFQRQSVPKAKLQCIRYCAIEHLAWQGDLYWCPSRSHRLLKIQIQSDFCWDIFWNTNTNTMAW